MSSAAISPGYGTRSVQVVGREFKSSLRTDSTPIVFVLDEDPSVRESLELLVRGGGWRCETFVSAQQFLAYPPPSVANCLVLDAASCPDVLGLQKRVVLERPGTAIIFMASSIELATAVKAIKAGAVEFFTKPCSEEALLSSIREALEHSHVMVSNHQETRALLDRYSALTRREREVMALVVSGMLNKQVGGELAISEITVKAHRGQVMRKMRAKSLADLVTIAAHLGIPSAPKVSLPPDTERRCVGPAPDSPKLPSGRAIQRKIAGPRSINTKVSPIPSSNCFSSAF